VVATGLVLGLASVLGLWGAWSGRQKLTAEELAGPGDRLHFEVVLRFPPEAFHVTRMQEIGRVIEVRGASVFLMDVRRAAARELARQYWVADVRRWPGR
jgi:hypothetical protein